MQVLTMRRVLIDCKRIGSVGRFHASVFRGTKVPFGEWIASSEKEKEAVRTESQGERGKTATFGATRNQESEARYANKKKVDVHQNKSIPQLIIEMILKFAVKQVPANTPNQQVMLSMDQFCTGHCFHSFDESGTLLLLETTLDYLVHEGDYPLFIALPAESYEDADHLLEVQLVICREITMDLLKKQFPNVPTSLIEHQFQQEIQCGAFCLDKSWYFTMHEFYQGEWLLRYSHQRLVLPRGATDEESDSAVLDVVKDTVNMLNGQRRSLEKLKSKLQVLDDDARSRK